MKASNDDTARVLKENKDGRGERFADE